ncbi:universal stress protein [Calidithermus roseus]|uniref:Universal stress protein family protein n=1 Tax=Calidithermus roseus TaxID=1644118 RepID=A0A399ED95_9DEIN|nr:universal stress protein [Calidithermus roseus]RIH82305.1 Universal stress protein family protein [Calidithermus roseus]
MFERILVPYNSGTSAQMALQQALQIAQKHGGIIHGLNVFDPAPYLTEPLLMDMGNGLPPQPVDPNLSMEAHLLKIAEDRAKESLDHLERECQAAGVRYTTELRMGDVAAQVLEAAHQADLMVLGRSGGGHKLRALQDTWVRRSPVPVWLAVGGASEPRQVVLAYDGGAKAADALQVAARLAQSWGLPLLLRAVREESRVDETTLRQAGGLLHELGIDPVSAELIQGRPAEALASLTGPHSLLVMGTHGHGVFLGLRFGRTVDGVIQGARGALLICP